MSAVTVVLSSRQRETIVLTVVCGSEKLRILGSGGRDVVAWMGGPDHSSGSRGS